MSEDKLDEGAEYGAFPFDYYIAISVLLAWQTISAHVK